MNPFFYALPLTG